MTRRRREHALERPRSRDSGFTLIELIISITLLGLVTGGLTASFITSIRGTQSGTERVRESNDAQLIAAYLTRDAQAAGGSDPATGSVDPSLGVSLTDAAGCADGSGTLVVRFEWLDRAAGAVSHRHVAAYYYDATAQQLIRKSCTDGTPGPAVTLGNHIGGSPAPPTATCNPSAACPGLPVTVQLTISETNDPANASTPYTYTLTASLRPEAQTSPTSSSAAAVPLLLLANGSSCADGAALAMSAQGGGASTLRIYGGAVISGYSPNCPSVRFQGSVDYIAAGGTSVLAPGTCVGTTCTTFTLPIGDPFASLVPPSGTCTNGSNPALGGNGHYQPGVYNQVLSVGNATFDSGTYTFCRGLTTSGTVTATRVLWYFAGGSLTVAGGNLQMSAPTTGSYPGLALWQNADDATGFQICCSNNTAASIDGTVYVPGAAVTLHNGNIWMRQLLAVAVAWEGGGNGGTSIGTIPAALAISGPAVLPAGTRGGAYPPTQITASGGGGAYTWSATGLPGGMAIDPVTGIVSGAPASAGAFPVTVSVSDSVWPTPATRTYTLTVNGPPIVSAPASLPAWTTGRPYPTTTMSATGGTTPVTWSATGLPAGLSMSVGGVLSGTPTATGTATVTVIVTDATGATGTRAYNLTINGPPSITTSGLPNAERGVGYSVTLASTGGTPSLTWSATGLPAGVSVSAGGVLSGSPTVTGTFAPTVTVTDAAGASASATFSLVVYPQLTVTAPASLPAWTRGRAYPPTTMTATGGTGTYSWSATGLPPGMSISATTGTISGTPSASGAFSVIVSVTDTAGPPFVATRAYTLTVNAPPVVTTTNTSVKKNKTLSFQLAATGGTAPLTWSISGQPGWVTLNPATGALGGTAPNSPNTSTFSVTVTDGSGATNTTTFTLTVN